MISLTEQAANYYNSEIKGYIWPDSCGQPCFYCGSITAWTVIANPDDAINGRLKTKCCSSACFDKYKAEMALNIARS